MGRDVSIKSILQGIIGLRRWELIENWRRQWWRLWSIRLQAIGLFLLAWGNLPLELWGMAKADPRFNRFLKGWLRNRVGNVDRRLCLKVAA